MELALLLAAFALGFAVREIGLPPLVGYLVAGFGLHALGFETTDAIEVVADLGIALLLFGIGLKLRPSALLRPEVLGTATAFAGIGTVGVAAVLLGLGAIGVPVLADLDPLGAVIVAFACSFCSTVFTVKVLEQSNESRSLIGRVAIGVLVLQDLLAVGFLVVAGGALPTIWALAIPPLLLVVRPLAEWVLDRLGHDETLLLFGFTMALGPGVELFDAVGLKPDLGALVVGALLARHRRAPELAGRMLDLKNLFLVGFFLSLGLQGIPTVPAWLVGAGLVLLVPLRSLLLVRLYTLTKLRVRTAFHTSLSLSTYSEFGLIVVTAALAEGLVGQEWVATMSVAVGISFVLGSVAMSRRYPMYYGVRDRLEAWEPAAPITEDAIIDVADARVLVYGMGRVGTGAYDELVKRRGHVVLGIDHDAEKVARQRDAGRDVILGNAMDGEFWERVALHPEIQLVVASMGLHAANVECVRRTRRYLPSVPIAAAATYPDQVAQLESHGCTVARYLFDEAGQAIADDAIAIVYGADVNAPSNDPDGLEG